MFGWRDDGHTFNLSFVTSPERGSKNLNSVYGSKNKKRTMGPAFVYMFFNFIVVYSFIYADTLRGLC